LQYNGILVEATGIGPFLPSNPNPMMANDFGSYRMKTFGLPRRFESPGVPSSPLESTPVMETFWRRRACWRGARCIDELAPVYLGAVTDIKKRGW